MHVFISIVGLLPSKSAYTGTFSITANAVAASASVTVSGDSGSLVFEAVSLAFFSAISIFTYFTRYFIRAAASFKWL
jgi:hypothetical protein